MEAVCNGLPWNIRDEGSEAVIQASIKRGSVYQFEIEDAIERYGDMVYRLAVVNTGSRFEADDIYQEVFLKLFRYRTSIQSEEHLKAWLIRVAVNQCKTAATSVWNKRKVSLDAVAEIAADPVREEYSEVYEAVKALPEKYRQIIHLFYYEELSIKEISQILERNEATVKTHLARGRKLLADRLEGSVVL